MALGCLAAGCSNTPYARDLCAKHYTEQRRRALGVKPRQPKNCTVAVDGDRIVIQTDARRSHAILMVMGGATLEEAGADLGVTRERVRQYLNDAGLTAKSRLRFGEAPVDRTRMYLNGHANRVQRYAYRQSRIRRTVRILKLFAAAHDRAPTYSELWTLVRGKAPANRNSACSQLSAYHGGRRGTTQVRRVHALYRLAGLHPRRAGGAGHVSGRCAA